MRRPPLPRISSATPTRRPVVSWCSRSIAIRFAGSERALLDTAAKMIATRRQPTRLVRSRSPGQARILTRDHVVVAQAWRYMLQLSTAQEVEVANRSGFGRGAFSFTLDMAPAAATPEPASVLLLGTGLAGVFGLRKRA